VFDSPGKTDPTTRRAAAGGEPSDAPWAAYAPKVRDASYQATDTDIADLTPAEARQADQRALELTANPAEQALLEQRLRP
jgi:hypothetical protein